MPQEGPVPAYEDMTLEEMLGLLESKLSGELPATEEQTAMGDEGLPGEELQQAIPEEPQEISEGPAASEVAGKRISASRTMLQNKLRSMEAPQ